MPKKPTAPVLDDDQDVIDDETFAEFAAEEERLHAALENPQSIRTGQATNIAKTKPRRSTVGRPKAIITMNPDMWGDTDEALIWPPHRIKFWLPEQLWTPPYIITDGRWCTVTLQFVRRHRLGGCIHPV